MSIMINIIIGIGVFFIVNFICWFITDHKFLIPAFLDYKPFNCRVCLTFWTLLFIAVTALLYHWHTAATIMALNILNTIALKKYV